MTLLLGSVFSRHDFLIFTLQVEFAKMSFKLLLLQFCSTFLKLKKPICITQSFNVTGVSCVLRGSLVKTCAIPPPGAQSAAALRPWPSSSSERVGGWKSCQTAWPNYETITAVPGIFPSFFREKKKKKTCEEVIYLPRGVTNARRISAKYRKLLKCHDHWHLLSKCKKKKKVKKQMHALEDSFRLFVVKGHWSESRRAIKDTYF